MFHKNMWQHVVQILAGNLSLMLHLIQVIHILDRQNNNGILDTNEQINSNRYTCDNSGALPNGEKGQYVFEDPSKERLFAYKTKGNSIIVYKLDQIIIGNHS